MRMQQDVRNAINALEQPQLLEGVEKLSAEQLDAFLMQLQKYDPSIAKTQKELVCGLEKKKENDQPWHLFERSGNAEDYARGEQLLRDGKVGCLILAGGQGTRLGFDGPKGAVPVTPIRQKSLFQLFCERIRAASIQAGCPVPLCIMTSSQNHAQTLAFFEAHHYFGLSPSQVTFFTQEMLPLLDDGGLWFLEEEGKLAEGPDGNGHALHLLCKNGIWQAWKDMGVEYLNLIFVDNALADPVDPEFVGFAMRSGVDAALKAVERLSPQEKMGSLCLREGKLKVVEYTEATNAFHLCNTGMFCLSMDFIQRLHESNAEFPLHLARKKRKVIGGYKEGWKCERFIFDLLDHACSSAVLVCPREHIYAPLKNAEGEKSLETVRQALLSHDRRVYNALTGLSSDANEFELDPAFYYPSELSIEKLKMRSLSEKDYISANQRL